MKLNILNDIDNLTESLELTESLQLKEDFSFQSRSIKGRKEEKLNIEKRKAKEFFGDFYEKNHVNTIEEFLEKICSTIITIPDLKEWGGVHKYITEKNINFMLGEYYVEDLRTDAMFEIGVKYKNTVAILLVSVVNKFWLVDRIKKIKYPFNDEKSMSFTSLKDLKQKIEIGLEKLNNVSKDKIDKLEEDFSFQSRGMKGRKEDKIEYEKTKKERYFIEFLSRVGCETVEDFISKVEKLLKGNGFEILKIDDDSNSSSVFSFNSAFVIFYTTYENIFYRIFINKNTVWFSYNAWSANGDTNYTTIDNLIFKILYYVRKYYIKEDFHFQGRKIKERNDERLKKFLSIYDSNSEEEFIEKLKSILNEFKIKVTKITFTPLSEEYFSIIKFEDSYHTSYKIIFAKDFYVYLYADKMILIDRLITSDGLKAFRKILVRYLDYKEEFSESTSVLKEDFKFQPRNINNRKEQKEELDKNKVQKILEPFYKNNNVSSIADFSDKIQDILNEDLKLDVRYFHIKIEEENMVKQLVHFGEEYFKTNNSILFVNFKFRTNIYRLYIYLDNRFYLESNDIDYPQNGYQNFTLEDFPVYLKMGIEELYKENN